MIYDNTQIRPLPEWSCLENLIFVEDFSRTILFHAATHSLIEVFTITDPDYTLNANGGQVSERDYQHINVFGMTETFKLIIHRTTIDESHKDERIHLFDSAWKYYLDWLIHQDKKMHDAHEKEN